MKVSVRTEDAKLVSQKDNLVHSVIDMKTVQDKERLPVVSGK